MDMTPERMAQIRGHDNLEEGGDIRRSSDLVHTGTPLDDETLWRVAAAERRALLAVVDEAVSILLVAVDDKDWPETVAYVHACAFLSKVVEGVSDADED